MPTISIDENVKGIAGLSEEDVTVLQADGITNEDDLGFIEFEDLSTEISVVKRRKLALIMKFLKVEGNCLVSTTTLADVKNLATTTKEIENEQSSEEGSGFGNVMRIAGLSNADVIQLQDGGIVNEGDLKNIEYADLSKKILYVKREKLCIIKQFLNFEKNILTPTTTLDDVLQATEEGYDQQREQLKPTITDPAYFEMCKNRYFLASKAISKQEGFKNLTDISKMKVKLEVEFGAKMGAGFTSRFLKPRGFKNDVPFGASMVTLNDEVCLHHNNLSKKGGWLSHYDEFASATKYGVLIFAGNVENFQTWAKSPACLKEVAQIRNGRLYVYIEHGKDDEGGRSGYIVHVDAENNRGSATVENGIGYIIWHGGNYYHGELKNSFRHGHGVETYADGTIYDGEFKDGKHHGHGVHTYADGDVYDGKWKNGESHGHGVYTFADGNVYDGEFKDGNYHGHGVETFADGQIYDGEFKDGKRHGNAIYTFPNGEKTKEVWENGKEISSTPI